MANSTCSRCRSCGGGSPGGGVRGRLAEAVDSGKNRIVVDLAEVSFIDSLSLSALVGARRKLGDDGRLAVVAVHEYVRLILQATGLEQVLDGFGTREEAGGVG